MIVLRCLPPAESQINLRYCISSRGKSRQLQQWDRQHGSSFAFFLLRTPVDQACPSGLLSISITHGLYQGT